MARLTPGQPPEVDATLRELKPCPVDRARELYRLIGAAYHWVDRLNWSEEAFAQWLDSRSVRVFEAESGGELAGYFELSKAETGEVEIAYFGLMPSAQGKGLGRWLLSEACRTAFAWGAASVWLHTCTLDAPSALPNYVARGFEPFNTEDYTVDLPA